MRYYSLMDVLVEKPCTKILFRCNHDNTSFEALIFREVLGEQQAQIETSEAILEIVDCIPITEKEYKAAYEEANYINSL